MYFSKFFKVIFLFFSLGTVCTNAVIPSLLHSAATNVHNLVEVKTVQDVFNWVQFQVDRAGGDQAVRSLPGKLSPFDVSRALSITTSFSGIAAPEMGLRMLGHYITKTTGKPTHFTVQGAVEWNLHSRDEMMHNPEHLRPQHLWIDQNEFLNPLIRGTVFAKVEKGITVEDLWSILRAPACVLSEAECQVCSSSCSMLQSSFHCAGSPCTDYSKMPGGLQKRTAGQTILPTLVWASLCLNLEHHIILHENVDSFPVELLEFLFACAYIITSCVVDLVSLGFPCRRRRRITILIHKTMLRMPSVQWSVAVGVRVG